MPEPAESLRQFLEQLAAEMKGVMDARRMNASGRSRRLIEAKVNGNHGELLVPAWIEYLERGRGPTRGGRGQGPPLQQIIRKWIDDKGIVARNATKDQLAFLITRAIHQNGTVLFQAGGRSGIISTVITQQRVDNFLTIFGEEILSQKSQEVMLLYKDLINDK